MKPAPFKLIRAADPASAGRALSEGDGAIKVLAGGQSLGPMLNLRLARPEGLIDVTAFPGMTGARETATHVEIGAAVTHARIEDGECPEPIAGMLRHVAGGIAYRAVRNRGTIGGSLCHADPAADWITAMTVLGASVVATGASGAAREIAMADFMLGAYRTALAPGEIVTLVRIPKYSAEARWGYHKICRKVGEFADAIGAFVADPASRTCRVVLGSTAGAPFVSVELAAQVARTGAPAALPAVKDTLRQSGLALSEIKIHQLAVAHRRSVLEALADA
jgi:carbon-monoxide dehydrogenase medium subunit